MAKAPKPCKGKNCPPPASPIWEDPQAQGQAAVVAGMLVLFLLFRKKAAGATGPRCSLVFTEANQGMFEAVWTKEPVEGALAYFMPTKTVQPHYFTQNLGRRELGRAMGTPRQAKPGGEYYCCWASFIKQAHVYAGPMTCAAARRPMSRRTTRARLRTPTERPRRPARSFCKNVEKLPVWIFLNKEGEVTRPSVGSTFSLKGISVAAVVPQLTSTEIVDVGQMAVKLFKDKCKKVGWTAHLESNVSAVQKLDTAKPVTLRRSSTYDDGTISLSTPEASPMR